MVSTKRPAYQKACDIGHWRQCWGDTDNDGLSQLAFNSSGSQLTQYAAGDECKFSINGLSVSSASNTVTDVIDGVTLNLLSATSSAITIDVKTDTDTIVADVQAFVDKYNAYATYLKTLQSTTRRLVLLGCYKVIPLRAR